MQFRNLNIGQSFDWINDSVLHNSFFKRCTKISHRRYRDTDGVVHTVGTVRAEVFHVDRPARPYVSVVIKGDREQAEWAAAARNIPFTFANYAFNGTESVGYVPVDHLLAVMRWFGESGEAPFPVGTCLMFSHHEAKEDAEPEDTNGIDLDVLERWNTPPAGWEEREAEALDDTTGWQRTPPTEIVLAVVDGDENADVYGYAATAEEAKVIAEATFADPVLRVEAYGPISLANGVMLPAAFVAITATAEAGDEAGDAATRGLAPSYITPDQWASMSPAERAEVSAPRLKLGSTMRTVPITQQKDIKRFGLDAEKDRLALLEIQQLLCEVGWNADTFDQVAAIMRDAGYDIGERI